MMIYVYKYRYIYVIIIQFCFVCFFFFSFEGRFAEHRITSPRKFWAAKGTDTKPIYGPWAVSCNYYSIPLLAFDPAVFIQITRFRPGSSSHSLFNLDWFRPNRHLEWLISDSAAFQSRLNWIRNLIDHLDPILFPSPPPPTPPSSVFFISFQLKKDKSSRKNYYSFVELADFEHLICAGPIWSEVIQFNPDRFGHVH